MSFYLILGNLRAGYLKSTRIVIASQDEQMLLFIDG